MKALGPHRARTLLEVLELPGDERWAFISRMYQRDDGEWLVEVLADVEQDLTGRPGRADRGAACDAALGQGTFPNARARQRALASESCRPR